MQNGLFLELKWLLANVTKPMPSVMRSCFAVCVACYVSFCKKFLRINNLDCAVIWIKCFTAIYAAARAGMNLD